MEFKGTIGEKLSPILVEIEDTLINHAVYNGEKPEFTDEGFRAGIKIFMDVMMDKLYEVQMAQGKSIVNASKEAAMMGYYIRALILQYTNIDTHNLYSLEVLKLINN